MTPLAAALNIAVGAGLLTFHPSRPLYMQQRPIALRAPDGTLLQGTLSRPRWRRADVPGHGERARHPPRFHILLASPAVPTGVEQYYSDLSGDGSRPPQVTDRRELEARVLAYAGRRGYDPLPVLARSTVPTLWLLGDRDLSVPTFASRRALDSLSQAVVRAP